MKPQFIFVSAPLSAALVSTGFAVTYLNVDQAQQAIFPGKTFTAFPLRLTDAQRKKIEQESRVRLTRTPPKSGATSGGDWFIVDEVIGKHEFITRLLPGIGCDSLTAGKNSAARWCDLSSRLDRKFRA